MREVALRMARAFEKLGFFIFEGDELPLVQEALEEAKLHETLRMAKLGDVDLKLKNVHLTTSYYLVALDMDECVKVCKDDECMRKCIEEKKNAVARGLREVKGDQKASDLSALLKKLKGSSSG